MERAANSYRECRPNNLLNRLKEVSGRRVFGRVLNGQFDVSVFELSTCREWFGKGWRRCYGETTGFRRGWCEDVEPLSRQELSGVLEI